MRMAGAPWDELFAAIGGITTMNSCSKTIHALAPFLLCFVVAGAYAQAADEPVDFGSDEFYRVPAAHDGLPVDTALSRRLQDSIDRAIDPDDYVCNAPTYFHSWVDQQVADLVNSSGIVTLAALSFFGAFRWAGDSTLLFDHDASDDYIGTFGEHTTEQLKRHKDNQRFWDAPVDDILLMGMHGVELSDESRMLPFLHFVFGFLGPGLPEYALETVQTLVEGGEVDLRPLGPFSFPFPIEYSAPGIPSGYYNPLFTLNAFAFSGAIPGLGPIPDKIVMGDGILDAVVSVGLGSNAPDFIHAHEFAHHVQFEIGAFEPGPPTPEKTRRTELMADAFAAYYSSHARGATFQAKRFADVMSAAFGVGDCAFDADGHHGTPDQREAAARWGGDVTASQLKKGHIESAVEMLALFEAELPNLVAPDAP